jgi:hypothetical protein
MSEKIKVVSIVLTVFCIFTHLPAALNDGLVLYLPYDEGSGYVTHDLANGYDGQIFYSNAAENGKWTHPTENVWTDGKFGSAIKLYGNGSKKIMDTHIINYTDSQDWAISFWVRRPASRHTAWMSSWFNGWSLDPTETTITQDESSVDWWSWDGGLQYDQLHMRYATKPYDPTKRELSMGFNAGGAWEKWDVTGLLGSDYGSGQWHHVAINIDGNPAGGETQRYNVSLFLDGVLIGQYSETGWGWGDLPFGAITIGCSEELKGIDSNDDIDDVIVWSRLLMPEEVATLSSGVYFGCPLTPLVFLTEPQYNGQTTVNGQLSWESNFGATLYDIYLGTNYDAVNNAQRTAPQCIPGSSVPFGDIDGDCQVDMRDYKLLAECWMASSSCNSSADLYPDGTIQLEDLSAFSDTWLDSYVFMGSQAEESFYPANLKVGKTYYWRVDGHGCWEPVKGEVWSFTVVSE